MNNWTKSLLELCGALAVIGTFCAAVGIKISELPASEEPPSDATLIELADMSQVVKSRKWLLTNLVFRSGSPTLIIQEITVNNLYVTNITQVDGTTYISNVTQILNFVTNYFTNVTWNVVSNTFNVKNGSIIITNTLVTINGTNVATINPTDSYVPYRAGSNYFADSTMFHEDGITKVEANVGAVLTVGDTDAVNMLKGSQTNSVTGAFTILHATNGLHGTDLTHVRWLFVPSGGPHTLTIPSGWRTNVYSAVPPALTNGTIYRMVVACGGPTADAASQTNAYVSFEMYQ